MASIFSEDMRIISFRGHSQVGHALGNYACVALGSPSSHVHIYPVGTGNCYQKSGSDLELTEVVSIFSEDDM